MIALLKSSLMLEGSGLSIEDVTGGARRPTVETTSSASPPDPNVEPIARSRRFSGSEKRRLLAEVDRCKANGQLGALLRHERLNSSMIASWGKQVRKAEHVPLARKKRGPKPKLEARQIKQLNRDKARLRRELERARSKPQRTLYGPGATDRGRDKRGRVMAAVAERASHAGPTTTCQAFSLNRAFVYCDRAQHQGLRLRPLAPRVRARPSLTLCTVEQDVLLGLLNGERFADTVSADVCATLLDESRYHCSIRTMYRLLAARNQTGERRRQRVHPVYAKPELFAVRPAVWSLDITKVKGAVKWETYQLYLIMAIFSRYVVGWMLAARESAELVEQFIADTIQKHNIAPSTSTLHADRGTSDPSSSQLCSSTWMSPRPTAVRTYRMTARTQKRSSKP